jgi:signal transduction histidine kinase
MNGKSGAPAPDAGSTRGSRRYLLPGLLLGAVVLSLIDASQFQYDRALGNDPVTWPHALGHTVPTWFGWALLTPLVLLLAVRIHALTGTVVRVALHVVTGLVAVAVHVALVAVASQLVHTSSFVPADFGYNYVKYAGLSFPGGMVVYALIVGGWYGARFQAAFRDREREARRLELETAELQTLLAQSQLRYLQAQLQPHFLFNALHALSSLVLKGDTARAVRMTARLGDLLRQALAASESSEIPFDREIRLLESYFDVQGIRFEGRLETTIEVDDAARDVLVPPLLLQPIAENAIVHAIEADPPGDRIAVTARVAAGTLIVEVADNGPGPDETAGEGTGLGNTRARLANLYGPDAALSVMAGPQGGTITRVTLPVRSRAVAADAEPAGVTRS